MNELQAQRIHEQAINFWTGESFEVCCGNPDCTMTGGMMKDGSYLVVSESHGYEIRIERTSDDELIKQCDSMVVAINKNETIPKFKAHWDLCISGEPVTKEGWLETEEICFWDEVASLYQEIPAWLVPAMDAAFEGQQLEQDLEAAHREAATVEFLQNITESINLYTESLGIEGQLDLQIDNGFDNDMLDDPRVQAAIDRIMDQLDEDLLSDPSLYLGPSFAKKSSKPQGISWNPMSETEDFFTAINYTPTKDGDIVAGDGNRELFFDPSAHKPLTLIGGEGGATGDGGEINITAGQSTSPAWFQLTPEEQKELDDFVAGKWGLSNQAEKKLTDPGYSLALGELFKNPKAQHEEGYQEACQCEMQTLMSNGCQCGGA